MNSIRDRLLNRNLPLSWYLFFLKFLKTTRLQHHGLTAIMHQLQHHSRDVSKNYSQEQAPASCSHELPSPGDPEDNCSMANIPISGTATDPIKYTSSLLPRANDNDNAKGCKTQMLITWGDPQLHMGRRAWPPQLEKPDSNFSSLDGYLRQPRLSEYIVSFQQ